MINSYRLSDIFLNSENYNVQKTAVEFKANAPIHVIPGAQLSITPPAIPIAAPTVTVAPTPAPAPAESLGIMGEINKFIERAIETISYFASSLKKFVMGLNLFKDWFVKV